MDHTALAYAAWAGHCLARGQTAEAEKYRKWAEEKAGRIVAGHIGGGDGLYIISEGGELCVEDVDYLIATLNIMRDGCKRRAEKRAAANNTTATEGREAHDATGAAPMADGTAPARVGSV